MYNDFLENKLLVHKRILCVKLKVFVLENETIDQKYYFVFVLKYFCIIKNI